MSSTLDKHIHNALSLVANSSDNSGGTTRMKLPGLLRSGARESMATVRLESEVSGRATSVGVPERAATGSWRNLGARPASQNLDPPVLQLLRRLSPHSGMLHHQLDLSPRNRMPLASYRPGSTPSFCQFALGCGHAPEVHFRAVCEPYQLWWASNNTGRARLRPIRLRPVGPGQTNLIEICST